MTSRLLMLLPLALFLMSGCATLGGGGREDLRPDEVQDLRSRLLGTVVQELTEAARPATVTELRITSARRFGDGSVKLGYHLEFETQDPDSGHVMHRLDSVATVSPDTFQLSDNEQVTVWRLVETTPPEQALEFRDPLVIRSPAPPAKSSP